jgi:hypothetical protein
MTASFGSESFGKSEGRINDGEAKQYGLSPEPCFYIPRDPLYLVLAGADRLSPQQDRLAGRQNTGGKTNGPVRVRVPSGPAPVHRPDRPLNTPEGLPVSARAARPRARPATAPDDLSLKASQRLGNHRCAFNGKNGGE